MFKVNKMKSIGVIFLLAIVVISKISAQENLTTERDDFPGTYLRTARAAESCDMRRETLSCTFRCMSATITRSGYCWVKNRSRRQTRHIIDTRCCNGKGTCICH